MTSRELRVLAVTLLVMGVVVGVLWQALAPAPEFRVRQDGLFYASTQPPEFIAMDGWFAGLALVAGAVTGVLAVRRDLTRPLALVVLAAGGLAAAVVAWQVGHLLGPDGVALPEGAVVGQVVHGPVDLEARGVLAVWPLTALVVVMLALGWRTTEPEPEPEPGREPEPSVRGDAGLDELDGRQ